jgi:uncharacterized protein
VHTVAFCIKKREAMHGKKYLSVSVIIAFGAFVLTVVSCKKDKEEEIPKSEFDRKAMLENIGNNIVVFNYSAIKTDALRLDSAANDFIISPDAIKLAALREVFKQTYLSWQNVSTFEFGPAEQGLLRVNTNTFPTDTLQINNNISTGSYDLASAGNIDAKGLPAIDYLLFGIGTDDNLILDKYINDPKADNRKNYLRDICAEVKSNMLSVYTSWISTGGNYINTFANNTGVDVGSSLGLLVNELNFDYEILKNFKIGIPLGKKTLGSPLPEKVEGYYGKNSVLLAVEHLKSIENIYLGRSKSGNDDLGLDDYLTHIDAQYNGGSLSAAIRSQFASTISKLQSIPDPLSETIMNDPAVVDAAYLEMQKLLVLLKNDMPSALGILITYQDNDGD